MPRAILLIWRSACQVRLRGIAKYAHVAVSGDVVDFGDVELGAPGMDQVLVLSNPSQVRVCGRWGGGAVCVCIYICVCVCVCVCVSVCVCVYL